MKRTEGIAGPGVLRGGSGEILRSVMDTIIPRGGAFGPGAADYDLLPRAGELIMSYDPSIRKLFPVMLKYVQYGALTRHGKVFTRLSEEKRIRFLESMEKSRFFYKRMIMLLLKLITMLTFYESDERACLTGYEHGCTWKK
ncbi:MAG: gluconate 2-dehydrogenase subunit 3 family protein [Spirochaetes bacterium]|nr:gluconate 2-dehydrogenase subunit 3 family protein [Spirochaetota bacterium]